MRKFLTLVFVLLLCLPAPPVLAEPTEEEMETAFKLSFEAFFEGSLLFAFGKAPAGVTADGKGAVFDNFDLTTLKSKYRGTYQTMTGQITKQAANLDADLTLQGGPVHHLKWLIEDYNPSKKKQRVQIEADGKSAVYETK